ncbi:YhcH/YjgK/YiaL family protein [Kallipyga massiliensis]|uniref:YhcH/YjgK/YiaL family protein n=1 Tax=Kallipyga massiliensis TaxID=1472764 RepID=UPI00055F5DF5|nr:YhcH/YjgK/YiaL family protein [Kallipyga massiliensis]
MIICQYSELERYSPILNGLKQGIEVIEKLRDQGFPEGRFDFQEGFLMVIYGETKDYSNIEFESHRDWVDVQYILSGGEKAYYLPINELTSIKSYDKNNDIEFFHTKNNATPINATPGMVYIAFPEDGHMPARHIVNEATSYSKIIMKLHA